MNHTLQTQFGGEVKFDKLIKGEFTLVALLRHLG
ncbi:MAG: hypothetical protein K0S51_2137 [Bacillales bacterium]|jgi:hypothetical protein|nr:hypothetical protein [Bacillales bacterium]